jgi:hypothetical protein
MNEVHTHWLNDYASVEITNIKKTPLTEAEITEIWMQIAMVHGGTATEFVREVEKRHGIGEQ